MLATRPRKGANFDDVGNRDPARTQRQQLLVSDLADDLQVAV